MNRSTPLLIGFPSFGVLFCVLLCVFFCVLLGAPLCPAVETFPVAHTLPLSLQILSGNNGTPQPRVHLVLIAGYNQRDIALESWREEAITDDAGMAQLSNSLRNLPLLRVEVLKHQVCAPRADVALLSIEQIRATGLATINPCGIAVVAAMPGVLTVFVKTKNDKSHRAAAVASSTSIPQPSDLAATLTATVQPAAHPSANPSLDPPARPSANSSVDEYKDAHQPQDPSQPDSSQTTPVPTNPDPIAAPAVPASEMDAPPTGAPVPESGQHSSQTPHAIPAAKPKTAPAQPSAHSPAQAIASRAPATTTGTPASAMPTPANPAPAPAPKSAGPAQEKNPSAPSKPTPEHLAKPPAAASLIKTSQPGTERPDSNSLPKSHLPPVAAASVTSSPLPSLPQSSPPARPRIPNAATAQPNASDPSQQDPDPMCEPG